MLSISKRTLQRYMADPLWDQHGGKALTFTSHGRPTRGTLSTAEQQELDEVLALYAQGHTRTEIAQIVQLPFNRIKYLLYWFSEKSATELRYTAETETLKKAVQLHESGMKWIDIPDELGITLNRLRYLRRKYPNLSS